MTDFYMPTQLEKEHFMRDSNAIEGDYCETGGYVGTRRKGKLFSEDVNAVDKVLYLLVNEKPMTLNDIFELHEICCSHIKEPWVGCLRKVDVGVYKNGECVYEAPNPSVVRRLMYQYIEKYPKFDAWEAHNEFQKVHPFEDRNGRVGRLLWLHKALQEGYDFCRSFLHDFYYSTLAHHHATSK